MAQTIRNFNTTNTYLKYNLEDHLIMINPTIFNSGYTFLPEFTGTTSSTEFYTDMSTVPLGESYDLGTLVKIIMTNPNDVNYFRKNTYLNIIDATGTTYRSLIVDLKSYPETGITEQYMVIETYKSNSGLTISEVGTIYNLGEISGMLYDVYTNDEYSSPAYTGLTNSASISYYRPKSANLRKSICNAYADFISQDSNVINETTAFLMQDSQNKFILKVYDPENLSNGGYVRLPDVITYSPTTITSKSAYIGGEVVSDGGTTISARGICYTMDSIIDPNMNNSYKSDATGTLGAYYCNIFNLTQGQNFYYRSFAVNNHGVDYGDLSGFTTLVATGDTLPTVYTNEIIETLNDNITISATVADTGWYLDGSELIDALIIERGIYYQTGITIPSDGNYTGRTYLLLENGLAGITEYNITPLTPSTTYSFRSYAENQYGISYGDVITITTTS